MAVQSPGAALGPLGAVWSADERAPDPPLEGHVDVDVAIVGGGITGLTAAVRLAALGRRVAVVEARTLGAGTSGGTSAHLTALPDTGLSTLRNAHGDEGARTLWNLQMAAIDTIGSLSAEHGIDCDFARIDGYLFAGDEAQRPSFDEEAQAMEALGLPHVPVAEVPGVHGIVHAALKVPDQARFDPLRYLAGLARVVRDGGGRIFEHSRALHVERGTPCQVYTERGRITARDVIVATHSPIGVVVSVHPRMKAAVSYLVAMRADEALPDHLWWDTASPYHYVRRYRDLLVVGGEDHQTGQAPSDPEEPYRRLAAWAAARFGVTEVVSRWAANLYSPSDGAPFVGGIPARPHLWMATGYDGNGLTFGTAAAEVLTAQIQGLSHPASRVLAPTRIEPLAEAGPVIRDNLDVVKHFVLDRLRPTPRERAALEGLPPGQGRLLRVEGKRVAAYRDDQGALTLLSPVCTHMGCLVHWNGSARTWDCPCHGGRYDPKGAVLDGPPVQGLDSREPLAPVFRAPRDRQGEPDADA